MSKQYGLIVKKPVQRPAIFDESDSDECTPTGMRKSVKQQDKLTQSRAIEEDPTVYQYDEVYDEMDKKRRETKLSRKDLDRKPKYINKLLAAADRRKRENDRRIERQVQKERETEGDEFKDKESFVTSSYKKKLEEMKEMEEQEKREAYLESIGDVTKQGNLDGFYRHLYDQKVNYEDESERIKPESESRERENFVKSDNEDSNTKSDKSCLQFRKNVQKLDSDDSNANKNSEDLKLKKNIQRKYRSHKNVDSEKSESEDESTKQFPPQLDADSDFSIDSSDSEEKNEKPIENTPKVDEKLSEIKENQKNEKKDEDKNIQEPPPKKQKLDIWKKRTVGDVFDAALQRYYERKAFREL